jgi:Respiratory-chain NADH dehydrogenase 51 Kd subunit
VNEPAGQWPWAFQGGLPRLLPRRPEDLGRHLARFGPVPYRGRHGALIVDVEASGLTGRGGAAFPAHRKLAIVADARAPKVVVANGAESEPASRKDETLIRAAPHLILDGLQLAAETVGASETYLYLHQGAGDGIWRALRERAASGQDLVDVTLAHTPPRFLAGQESAVVNRLGGGPAIPVFTPPRVTEHGLGGQPTLVQNVETLAHLALIARYGPRWFRALGTPAEPGSMLATCYPASGGWRVTEAAIGTPLATLLGPAEEVQAWLVGGYHGSWLAPDARLALDNGTIRAVAPPRRPRRRRTLGCPGLPARCLQPPRRHCAFRPQCLAGLRAGVPPPRARALLGCEPPAISAAARRHSHERRRLELRDNRQAEKSLLL